MTSQTPSEFPPSRPPGYKANAGARSLGLKLIAVLFLVVLMAVPILFISLISFERSDRASDVTREISQTYGGSQTLLGPVIVLPYQQKLSGGRIREGDYIVSATTGAAVFKDVTVEAKTRSLYKVPVYAASGTLTAQFEALSDTLPNDPNLIFDRDAARLIVGLQDVTGLQSDVTLKSSGQTLTFEPYQRSQTRQHDFGATDWSRDVAEAAAKNTNIPTVIEDWLSGRGLTLLSVPLREALGESGAGSVSVDMSLTGAPSLAVLPYARSTNLNISSDWPHPGFAGRFPPGDRTITENGFSAQWSVPFLRRGLAASGPAFEMNMLLDGDYAMRVNFVSPLNPYQTVNRALKYAVMFIGLVFLAYFLMETLLGVRVHPAQYLLIGLAQAVFYLLLLAFAEQVGFNVAFLLSSVATVALTSLYTGAVFGRSLIWKSALVFGTVYGLLFVLMRIQDFALMVGALVCFVAIAATLYLTRNLDWYGGRPSPSGDNSSV
jgi:inner membrane protein